MTTSALVVVLADAHADVPPELSRVDGLTLGAPADAGRVPAVLETAGGWEAEDTFRHLTTLPGVARVEVVFVGFDGDEPATQRDTGARLAPSEDTPS